MGRQTFYTESSIEPFVPKYVFRRGLINSVKVLQKSYTENSMIVDFQKGSYKLGLSPSISIIVKGRSKGKGRLFEGRLGRCL